MHQSSMQELKKQPKDSYVPQAKAKRVMSIVALGNGSLQTISLMCFITKMVADLLETMALCYRLNDVLFRLHSS